ncbi:hypothetical protein D3C74_493150 [compost metagenome]
MLENHPDLASLLLQFGFAQFSQIDPVNPYFTLRRPLQQINTANQCTFTRSGMANNAVDFTLLDVQIQLG